ncbi:radical SAM/SPASM domain-containing protein [Paraclostridium bifermentans]|uniref:radical SAM/SPASM domain-containing protein n=1 Tax=Paraclostridium bifermentans TaxID=1490 RepID=UPI0018A963E8|nr:radical SAM protein [Paraclostridium bifermentans]
MLAAFWTTTNCNLKCRYCYEGEDKVSNVMPKDVVDQAIEFIINQKKDKDELVIQFHGGEPFLEFETIKYIVNKVNEKYKHSSNKPAFVTTTNATIMNDEILDFIINNISNITISIDGAKSTHDYNRITKNGNATHDSVLKNSKKLLEHIPRLRVRMTFDTETVGNLYEDVKFLIDEGFKVIVPVADLYEKRWNDEHVKILESQIIKMKRYIESKNDVLLSIVDTNIYKEKGLCDGGVSSFHIYPDGKLYPCTLAGGNNSFCIGDVNNGVDIKRRDYILNYSETTNEVCDGCSLCRSCEGNRCKIINKLITNDYFSPPPMHCAIQNLRYKLYSNEI